MKAICICLVLFLTSIRANVDVFMIKVEPRSEDCFYQDVKAGDTVSYEYHVVDGGLLDVEIRVSRLVVLGCVLTLQLFRQETRYYSKLYFEGKDESTFTFTAETTGPYALCFNNEMSRWTVKTITFSIRVKPAGRQGTADTDLTPLESTIQRMEEDFEAIEKEQAYYRVREHTHRSGKLKFFDQLNNP